VAGNVTTSVTPKDGVAPEPQKDFLSEYSIVVDLNQRVVFGFWFEDSAPHWVKVKNPISLLPILERPRR
jgi:hypothetical protein